MTTTTVHVLTGDHDLITLDDGIVCCAPMLMPVSDAGSAHTLSGRWMIVYPEEEQAEKAINLGFSFANESGDYLVIFPICTWHRIEPIFRGGNLTVIRDAAAWCQFTSHAQLSDIVTTTQLDSNQGWQFSEATDGLHDVTLKVLMSGRRGDFRYLSSLLGHSMNPPYVPWIEL